MGLFTTNTLSHSTLGYVCHLRQSLSSLSVGNNLWIAKEIWGTYDENILHIYLGTGSTAYVAQTLCTSVDRGGQLEPYKCKSIHTYLHSNDCTGTVAHPMTMEMFAVML